MIRDNNNNSVMIEAYLKPRPDQNFGFNGNQTNGVEAALAVLKKMVRERNRSIFLVSHREELQGRVSNVLNVVKENGFTNFSQDEESVDPGIELDTII